MAGAPHHGGATSDRLALWTPAETNSFLASVRQFVIEFTINSDAVLDQVGLEQQSRSKLRALLTDQTLAMPSTTLFDTEACS